MAAQCPSYWYQGVWGSFARSARALKECEDWGVKRATRNTIIAFDVNDMPKGQRRGTWVISAMMFLIYLHHIGLDARRALDLLPRQDLAREQI